jgi:hypothetical protein
MFATVVVCPATKLLHMVPLIVKDWQPSVRRCLVVGSYGDMMLHLSELVGIGLLETDVDADSQTDKPTHVSNITTITARAG